MMRGKNKLYQSQACAARLTASDQAWWSKDRVLIVLVILLSALDAVTLYTVFDSVLYQSAVASVVLMAGVAVALNFIPLVMARVFHQIRYRMGGSRPWMLAALLITFAALFSASFFLRWTTRDLSFSGAESSLVDLTGQAAGISGTDSDSDGAVAITILLGVLPAITSVINFFLAFLTDDPVRRQIDQLEKANSELKTHLGVLFAAREELDQDWMTRLRELDEGRCKTACACAEATGEYIEALARFELGQKLGDPDSISRLTE